jgi:hypothetical protein
MPTLARQRILDATPSRLRTVSGNSAGAWTARPPSENRVVRPGRP